MNHFDPPPVLLEVVQGVRRIHESMVAEALGTTSTAGTCFYSAVMLRTSVARFTPFLAEVRGGGDGDGGYLDFTGLMRGHYWVVAWREAQRGGDLKQDEWVLDITCDQFGGPPVMVIPLEFASGRYVSGSQRVVDEHVETFGAQLGGELFTKFAPT